MPDINDFHSFKSTSSGTEGLGCGAGCLSPTTITVCLVLFLLHLIGKLGG